MGNKNIDYQQIGQTLEESHFEIFVFNEKDFKFIYTNKGAQKNIGYTQKELLNLHPWDLKPDYHEDKFKKFIKEKFKSSKVCSFETVHRRKDGSIYAVRINLNKSKYNNIPSYFAVIIDVTEESDIRKKERTQERFIKETLEAIPGAIFCKDYQETPGTFVFWNKAAEKLFGLDGKKAIGKSDFDFFPKEEAAAFQEMDLKIIKSGKEDFIPEEAVTSSDNSIHIVKTWKVPMVIDHMKYLLGISFDITEQKSLEKELETEKMINFQNSKLASLGEMASGIAHEINNPLTLLQTYNLVIGKMLKTNDYKKLPETLEKIEKGINRIAKIVSSMKSISRNTIENRPENTSLNHIIDEVKQISGNKFDEFDIKLLIENNLQGDVLVCCRSAQIEQILINLLSNAIRITQDQKEKWVKMKLRKNANNVFIHVIDPGKGIPKEVEEKLFQPFFTTTEIGEGTGLGLSISRNIAKQHNGNLEFLFDGSNTNFVLTLPMAQAQKKTG
jgi:PAS domain S-box-containing protein